MSHVTVIGAGIVGSCCARVLVDQGHEVTLVDRIDPGMGCSFGNAGVISNLVSSMQPPGPRLLKKLPSMLTDRDATVTIRSAYLLRVAPWLLAMLRGCTTADQARSAAAMASLLADTTQAYDRMVRGTAADAFVRRNGTLGLYSGEETFRADAWRREANMAFGVEIHDLAAEEIRQMEPSLTEAVGRAVYIPSTYSTDDPGALTRAIADEAVARGARFVKADVAQVRVENGRPTGLDTSAGELPVDRLVVAAGAFSHRLARSMGIRVLLEAERGYHVELPDVTTTLSRATLHYEHAFGLNQTRGGLRLAGTVEFGGVDAPETPARAEVIWRRGRNLVRELEGVESPRMNVWMGRRPTLPDFRPMIGPAPGVANCWFAFGHQHLGLTFGARTGELVGELVAGRDPGVDLAPFRADRF